MNKNANSCVDIGHVAVVLHRYGLEEILQTLRDGEALNIKSTLI